MATSKRQEIMDYSGEEHINTLVEPVSQLVSLPDVYYRLESTIEDPTSSIDDFASILSTDVDLCARILTIANSAFYSFPASVESIEKALQLIGIRQVRELVLATYVVQSFEQVPLGMVDMRSFWEHSLAVGVTSRCIARYARQKKPERFFVSGLLHDIGRLVFYLKLPGMMHDLLLQREKDERLLFELEQETLGYTHADAGGRLLQLWRIPDSIYEPILFHHHPQAADDFMPVSCAIHIADAWVNRHMVGSSGERFAPKIDPVAFQTLGFEEYEMDELWDLSLQTFKEIKNQFLAQ